MFSRDTLGLLKGLAEDINFVSYLSRYLTCHSWSVFCSVIGFLFGFSNRLENVILQLSKNVFIISS